MLARTLIQILNLFNLLFLLTGCQLYRNNGRNLFENQAPGQIINRNVGITCWGQPKNEALWFFESNSIYRVKTIDEQSIEVCLENNTDTQSNTTL